MDNAQPTIAEACATSLFINLHDLAQRANGQGKRLAFTDDVVIEDGVSDITDLISKLRNAVCHIRSPSRTIQGSSFVFNRFTGKVRMQLGENLMGCDYDDDMAIYYGHYRFYLGRHGHRVLYDLKQIFA